MWAKKVGIGYALRNVQKINVQIKYITYAFTTEAVRHNASEPFF